MDNGKEADMATAVKKAIQELEQGMKLGKCKKCGCMRDLLQTLEASLPGLNSEEASLLLERVGFWIGQLQETQYSCLGCKHCHPSVATNALNKKFPGIDAGDVCGSFEVGEGWPAVPGEYHVLSRDSSSAVAISTLANAELADDLADRSPKGLAIVGKTETENIGIDKVIKNIVTNPSIRYLVLCGDEPKGHMSGHTLEKLWENGVDDSMRVIGSSGKRPILRNVSRHEIEAFRKQVKVIDMIGEENPQAIIAGVSDLAGKILPSASRNCGKSVKVPPGAGKAIEAKKHKDTNLDKAGYFVIIPQGEGLIMVEHYSYENKLLRTLRGTNARDIYLTVIENGWVTELSHAAYLGKELTLAELSMKSDVRYVQDRA